MTGTLYATYPYFYSCFSQAREAGFKYKYFSIITQEIHFPFIKVTSTVYNSFKADLKLYKGSKSAISKFSKFQFLIQKATWGVKTTH